MLCLQWIHHPYTVKGLFNVCCHHVVLKINCSNELPNHHSHQIEIAKVETKKTVQLKVCLLRNITLIIIKNQFKFCTDVNCLKRVRK